MFVVYTTCIFYIDHPKQLWGDWFKQNLYTPQVTYALNKKHPGISLWGDCARQDLFIIWIDHRVRPGGALLLLGWFWQHEAIGSNDAERSTDANSEGHFYNIRKREGEQPFSIITSS